MTVGLIATTSANGDEIDEFSRDCIVCHDGNTASEVHVDFRNNPSSRNSLVTSRSADHPIGMNYNNYVAANRGYKPVSMSENMLFVNGTVGCLTCHDPMNPDAGHLVKSDRNSALCGTCHDK